MKAVLELLEEVESLAFIYGPKGDGEQWLATVKRIERLGQLAKKARKDIAKAQGAA